MSVLGVISEIMEDEELEEEESNEEDDRWYENISSADHDIVDAVNESGDDHTCPESFDGFELGKSLPAECALCE